MQNILQQLSILDAMLIILGVIFLFVSWTINPINGMMPPHYYSYRASGWSILLTWFVMFLTNRVNLLNRLATTSVATITE